MKTSTIFFLFSILIIFTNCKKHKENHDIPKTSDESLVAHFTFNGNARDSSIYLNHGIIYGATLINDSLGNLNNAYSFNGTDNYINVPTSPSLNTGNAITISAWIKPISTSGQYIVSKAASSGGGGPYSLDIYPGSIRFMLDLNNLQVILNGAHSIKQNVWQHISATYDGSVMKVYYNGQLDGSTLASGTIDSSTGTLQIATYIWGQTFFNGTIDNIRIYKRALTSSEVLELYNGYK
jgi:hypothetical protein